MAAPGQELKKTLSIGHAVGLAITIVVGSGLLVLPGLAYAQSGDAAIHAWLINAVLVIPLLFIFAYLGSAYPTAGGVAGFLQAAFSRKAGAATEILLIGTFGLGIPAIALTGGHYFSLLLGGGGRAATLGAFALILVAGAINYLGAAISGRVQQFLAFFLVAIIFLVAVLALTFGDLEAGEGIGSPSSWPRAVPALGMVFFAYTGWEMLSFTAEEYKNPKRDFPIVVVISFLVVVALYLLIAAAVQLTLSAADPIVRTSPVAALLDRSFGSHSGKLVAVLGTTIIMANLIGASWAASRLIFASSREGLLPRFLSTLSAEKTPKTAIVAVTALFLVVLALHSLRLFNLEDLLRLAGQNFFILYGMSVLAFIMVIQSWKLRLFGSLTLVLVLLMMGTFGWELLYPAALFCTGMVLSQLRAPERRPR